jgi:hypothetical protein
MKPDNPKQWSAEKSYLGKDSVFVLLKMAVFACLFSSITVPFVNSIWLGELPLMALFQLPKIGCANWMIAEVVIPGMDFFGISSGSYSPDHISARPYALGFVYLLPLLGVILLVRIRRGFVMPYRAWVWGLVIAATVDFFLTMHFRTQPGLTIY